MGDVGGFEILDYLGGGFGICEVDADEFVVRVFGDGLEREGISGVGECVDVHELDIWHLRDKFEEEVCSDKATSASHKDSHDAMDSTCRRDFDWFWFEAQNTGKV